MPNGFEPLKTILVCCFGFVLLVLAMPFLAMMVDKYWDWATRKMEGRK